MPFGSPQRGTFAVDLTAAARRGPLGKPPRSVAQAGASTKEIMARGGHSSVQAAIIYEDNAASRSRVIADVMAMAAEPMTPVGAAMWEQLAEHLDRVWPHTGLAGSL
jgi:hypothetical protein